ncbi:hypothetical protein [Novosphingobium sp. PC22D]|uniref:hypothetical protein n=1 Tax=Novosphingobium sp. PC22D TaxID=1962403 RepID=UPI0011452F24|nr:hypothetical protein [Novosphingobium sp. PC22D]
MYRFQQTDMRVMAVHAFTTFLDFEGNGRSNANSIEVCTRECAIDVVERLASALGVEPGRLLD